MKIWKHSQIRLWSMIPRRLRSSTSRRGHSESLLGYPWNVLRLTICQTMQKFSRLVWIPLESQWDVSRIWFQWSYNLHELRKALGDPLYDHWNQIRARLRIQKNHTHTISNQNCFFLVEFQKQIWMWCMASLSWRKSIQRKIYSKTYLVDGGHLYM